LLGTNTSSQTIQGIARGTRTATPLGKGTTRGAAKEGLRTRLTKEET